MSEEREAIDVGQEMADLLLAWRPEMNSTDVVDAIMHALERYSIEIEGSGELGLASCIRKLEKELDDRRRSI